MSRFEIDPFVHIPNAYVFLKYHIISKQSYNKTTSFCLHQEKIYLIHIKKKNLQSIMHIIKES